MKRSTTFIVMPPPLFYLYQLYQIVHYPNIHILCREERKLLFMHMLEERGTRSASSPNVRNTHTGLDSASKLSGLITWVNQSVKGVLL